MVRYGSYCQHFTDDVIKAHGGYVIKDRFRPGNNAIPGQMLFPSYQFSFINMVIGTFINANRTQVFKRVGDAK